MEQIATIQTAPAAQPSLRKLLGMAAGQQAGGDAFSMIFQQLLEGDGGFLELLGQMAGQEDQEDARELGAQMAAEMLCMAPGAMPQAAAEALQRSDAAAQAAGTLFGRTEPQAPDGTQAAQTAWPQAAPPKDGLTAPPEDFQKALQGAWTGPDETRQAPQALAGMDGAVREARKLLAQQPKERTAETPDVEQLQADVNAKRFLPDQPVRQAAQGLPDMREIAGQIKTGILRHAAGGRQEFVVRLEPEGLGEITVKLSEDRTHVSLSIFTSSPQVAKLITNEVAALQNALRPLQAEVQQITVLPPEAHGAAYAFQSAMTDQGRQFAGRQFAGGRQDRDADPEDGGFEELVQGAPALDGELDAYI